nr:transposase [Eggerthella sinensis]
MRELYHLACGEIAGICPRAAGLLEDAEADALAYLDFPYAHHRRIRTNNVQERANRELKRRSRVVQVFPSRKSLIRMLGAVFSEMDEDWASRRWFTEESIALAVSSAKSAAPARPTTAPPENTPGASWKLWSPTTRSEGERRK